MRSLAWRSSVRVTEIVVVGHVACRMATFKSAEFVDLFRGAGSSPRGVRERRPARVGGGYPGPDPRRAGVHPQYRLRPLPSQGRGGLRLLFDETTGALTVVERGEAKEAAAWSRSLRRLREPNLRGSKTEPQEQELDTLMGAWPVALRPGGEVERKTRWPS